MTDPRVAIAICSFNTPEAVVDCLAALGDLTYRNFEVVICENGDRAAFETLRGQAPESLPRGQPVRLMWAQRNLGFAGGVNLAIRAAPDADAWWVLNPDTKADADSLWRMIETLERTGDDAIGCTIYFPTGKIQAYGGRWSPALARSESIGYGAPLAAPIDVDRVIAQQNYLVGASMLMTRTFIETVGLMREDYFLYCEELEWFRRGRGLGMKLGYAPDARVLHVGGVATGATSDARTRSRLSVYLIARNSLLLVRGHDAAWLPVACLALAAGLLGRYGRKGAWRQLGFGLSGLVAGLMGRTGPPPWIDVQSAALASD